MSNVFRVRVLEFTDLREIEGFRTPKGLGELLDAMDFGDRSGLSDDELREICLMSLQDLGPQAAAAVLLAHDLGDCLTSGQIQNIASDMQDEKMWEEYADMGLHERMFHAGSLLYAAFPGDVPEPDAVRVRLEIVAANDDAEEALAAPLHESLLVRLLADGMGERSVLQRLFERELAGPAFPEAAEIVWIVETTAVDARTRIVSVTSSGHWLDALRDTRTYESKAHAD